VDRDGIAAQDLETLQQDLGGPEIRDMQFVDEVPLPAGEKRNRCYRGLDLWLHLTLSPDSPSRRPFHCR
jgi:hypothetical protein